MLSVICILCVALALWLAATLFLWHRELLEIQKALEDIGAGNLNRRIVTRGPQAIRSIGYGINKIVQQNQQSAIQQKRHEQAYKQLITNLSHDTTCLPDRLFGSRRKRTCGGPGEGRISADRL